MSVDHIVTLETPLANALNSAIQPKLIEVGWSTGGDDDSALTEYIMLMLANGKTQEQIAAELSGDLLNLGPDDPGARDFSQWLFEQVDYLNTQFNNVSGGFSTGESENTMVAMEGVSGGQDADMGGIAETGDVNVPTGPKSMRNGGNGNGNRPRDRRMLGHLAKAMDRTNESVLHRVRPAGGNERINTHARAPPTGPRQVGGRGGPRMQTGRPMGGMSGMPMQAGPGAAIGNMSQQQQLELYAMLEQQSRMMAQMFTPQQQQAMMMGGAGPVQGFQQQQQPGKSLFDRVQSNPHHRQQNGFRNGHAGGKSVGQQHNSQKDNPSSMDVELAQERKEPSADDTCRFNLGCTNKDCKFAHQSPAAPVGTTIDISDVCSFGAACKNRKCTGRHPSPAQKIAHQTELDCKFFPNCTNPRCPFKHPTMPLCRNGADCTTPNCTFTHVKTVCKFNPCLNPSCSFKHVEGQKRGQFGDKVWVADDKKEHVSERKFVDDETMEELIVPGASEAGLSQGLLEQAQHYCVSLYTTLQSSYGGNPKWVAGVYCRDSSGPRQQYAGVDGVPYVLEQRRNIISRHGEEGCGHTLLAKPLRVATGAVTAELKERKRDRIAVLGGGITGLASAYFLAKHQPDAKIDIYESSNRLGGWLNSKRFETPEGSVVFEQGPRTLRPSTPAGKVTISLIRELGLEDQLIITGKDSDAARNRFIYYPDRLVKMPGPGQDIFQVLWTLLKEPVFAGLGKIIYEPFTDRRDRSVNDESVGSFLERRMGGSEIGNNVVSAVLHGIYAGDIYKLSARSLLPTLYADELRFGSIVRGQLQRSRYDNINTIRDHVAMLEAESTFMNTSLALKMKSASVYTFKEGISTLSGAIEKSLLKNPNVRFKLGHQITNIQYNKGQDEINVKTNKNLPVPPYANVISTISGRTLSHLTADPHSLPSLRSIDAVTVMVVNLYYSDQFLLDERGFGYLIPRSIPFEQNPECALGVVFDSDSTTGQDQVAGTKLTVMLGGHWWDGLDAYPDEAEGKRMAMAVIKRHLHIDAEPELVNVGLHKNCIPQYTVGHHYRMGLAHDELKESFGGRLTVAGNSYTGVGLNDCIHEAKLMAHELCFKNNDGSSYIYDVCSGTPMPPHRQKLGDLTRSTGLEQFRPYASSQLVGFGKNLKEYLASNPGH
ncbi:nuclear polyadenylated RNA-binding protein nab2 [Phlyctema vagabunda]|uniref:protoporphyrinogen oxidase n=1 Tax=Phlyctema vagabunda TaxID=108571 RepID=A0ABR4P6U7_9HELO